jgi:hypothetical protein
MLRVTLHDSPGELRLCLEGKLAGPWVGEVQLCWETALSAVGRKNVLVDLRGVDFVDGGGEALLAAMHQRGVTFLGEGPMLKHLLAEITGVPEEEAPQPAPRGKARLHLRLLSLFLTMVPLGMGAEPLNPEVIIERYLTAVRLADCNRQERVFDVVVEASLPRLHKHGTLRAVQYLSPARPPHYDAVRFDGDATIEKNVIARYLGLDQQAARQLRSMAVSPANYRFRFQRVADYNGRPAYVFRLEPNQKRTGLFRGELWLDARTFLPLREWGQLVKSPSLFIKRVYFVRDFLVVDGRSVPRRTIAKVSTRLAGPAEVTVWSRCVTVKEQIRLMDHTLLGSNYVQHGSRIVGSDACAL